MAVHRCPECSIPCLEAEVERGVCPGCGAALVAPPESPRRDVPAPAPAAAPSRAVPFLVGFLVGGVVGTAALWAASRPGGGAERTAALQAARDQKAEAEDRARESEAARAESRKALEAANRRAESASKQKQDADQRLQDALARLAEEQKQRASLEKALAEEKKSAPAPTRSFVRDWQLLGPFPSSGEQGHDAVFPPEREPFRIDKAYDGFGGRVRWRPYHSPEDRIDLAGFFQYWRGGAAYAVSWAYSDADRAVSLGVGSDDGVRVWVNGEKVEDVKGGRQARPGQDVVKAHLKKGWNEVRAKVDNIVGTWELYLEFRTPDGQPLKVFSTSSPPPATAR